MQSHNDQTQFSTKILQWWQEHGRKNLPWQQNRSDYHVWISEVMLQQTQVETVIRYYNAFLRRFPDIYSLAQASLDDVLRIWSGLGYYSRARNLHKSAKIIVKRYQGHLPSDQNKLEELPGIGRSTAGAILASAYGQRGVILDGNVRRVLCRFHALEGWPGQSTVLKKLWQLADSLTPETACGNYAQAIMDLGALLCTPKNPDCQKCPLITNCQAYQSSLVDRFPERRPIRAQRKTHHIWLLLIRNSLGEWLLEKRVREKRWAGLWSFPEWSDKETAINVIENALMDDVVVKDLALLTHDFTHMRIHFHPLQIQLKTPQLIGVFETPIIWYKNGNQLPGGHPVPVQKLLRELV